MTAGHDHGRSIVWPDVVEGEQNVDLPAAKLSVVVAKLRANASLVGAGVHARGRALRAHVGKGLIDKEAVVTADVALHVRQPGRVIYEAFKGFAHLKKVV